MKTTVALAAAVAALVSVSPASAAVTFSSTDFGFTASGPAASTITFDGALPSGFALSGGLVRNVSDAFGAEPAIAQGVKETSNYLAANPSDAATITSTRGYRNLSFFWGSIDGYNKVTLLDRNGGAIRSFGGSEINPPANGNQFEGATNRQVSFATDGDTSPIYGVRFESSQPALEVDNVSFSAAVPETSTWAMMILGVGATGAALRRAGRRSRALRPATSLA